MKAQGINKGALASHVALVKDKKNMLPLNEMAIFTKVVETGSFSRAATLLGLPKSNVSRKVALLEEKLGVRLLERTTRALKLTEIGATYYEHCARIVSEAEEANLAVTQMQATPRGKLRITAPTEFGIHYLGEIVAAYLKQYPHVEVEVDLTNRVVDLIEEGFDLAIRGGVMADSSLMARKLASEQTYICASPAYLKEHGCPQTPEDLARHDMILSSVTRLNQLKLSSAHGNSVSAPIHGRFRGNSLAMARDAALAGLGLAILPEMICWKDLQTGALQPVLTKWQLAEGGIYGVYPTPRHLSTKVKTFLDLLSQKLNPPPWKKS